MVSLDPQDKITQLIKLAGKMGLSESDVQIARDLIIEARNGHRFAFAAANQARADLFKAFVARAGMILGEDLTIDVILLDEETKERLRNGGRLKDSGKSLC